MSLPALAAAFVATGAAAVLGTGLVLRLLRARPVLDHPSERSSHTTPTLRGGGLAVVPVILAAWVVIGVTAADGAALMGWVIAAAAMIAIFSWADDLKGLAPLVRFLAHIAAVALALALTPFPGLIFQGLLPAWLDLAAAGLAWLWFMNLFNFMDGIDGLAGMETGAIGIGAAVVTLAAGAAGGQPLLALALAGGGLGFLWYNWQPAKIFLGDVGSIGLGFMLGWLLLDLAARGHWAPAVIVPLYYLSDATITLFRRLLRGEKIWRAHRRHYYQTAVARGLSHAHVVLAVAAVNVGLIALAWAATGNGPWLPLAGAGALVGALIVYLAKAGTKQNEI